MDGNIELGLEEEDEENHSQPDENDIELDEENHSQPDENDIEIDEENPGAENVVSAESSRKLRVTVQDYGAGIALPRYGGSQSNLTLNNMNFVNCANRPLLRKVTIFWRIANIFGDRQNIGDFFWRSPKYWRSPIF